jgi:hypothetical protein
MFSNCQTPFAGMKNEEVSKFVKEGGRLEKPTDCSSDLFEVMLKCWSESPSERTSFSKIHHQLKKFNY